MSASCSRRQPPDESARPWLADRAPAGFPIGAVLFTADEVAAGEIDHAIRFILPNARMRAGVYVHPASHAGSPSGGANLPPARPTSKSFSARSRNTACCSPTAATIPITYDCVRNP